MSERIRSCLGKTHNVFGIQVGVSINFFIKRRTTQECPRQNFLRLPLMNFGKKEDKYRFLDSSEALPKHRMAAICNPMTGDIHG